MGYIKDNQIGLRPLWYTQFSTVIEKKSENIKINISGRWKTNFIIIEIILFQES